MHFGDKWLNFRAVMEIILYDSRGVGAQKPKRPLSFPGRYLGYGLFISSLAALFFLGSPFIAQEIAYRLEPKIAASRGEETFGRLLAEEKKEAEQKKREIQKEAESYGVKTDFSLVIPKISAASPVIANVNAADEDEYRTLLKEGVAHAAGSSFPGSKGTVYLFAHSTDSPLNITRYNAVFYLLKELKEDDEIIIFFAGQKYRYRVAQYFITQPKDLAWLEKEDSFGERLVLQTCWPPGTSLQRLIVIAQPV